ncbi:transposase, partial [Streptomyces sp. NPDC059788]|uniref:transposase n=1 Tax=Streptomyces sp. NPDC059788 TaxID=3346948 RepID=UPI0036555A55
MSMRPEEPGEVPAETVRVARAAFPKGSLMIRIRDELGVLFTDEQFVGLFAARGKPAFSPGRLALVSVLQFVEGLPDRQAAQAVRGRIDWKYALGLELADAGFDYSVLSEFRARLAEADGGQAVFDRVLAAAREAGLLPVRGRARTDSTHVLAAIRSLNRLEFAIETLRAALNALAAVAPGWLAARADPAWYDRYAARAEEYWLPKGRTKRSELADRTGADGMRVLNSVFADEAPGWLREVPAVQVLRKAWVQEFFVDGQGQVRQRTPKDRPPGAMCLASPYDVDARYSVKRDTKWDGFKVHLTESCDDGAPRLLTDVTTTPATVSDDHIVKTVHARLAGRAALPGEHWADAGYVNAAALTEARRDHGVDLHGPLQTNTTVQAA